MVIAATPNVVNSCGGGPTVTAVAGTGTFTIGGSGVNAAVGASTCTVSVDVTSSLANIYTNGAGNVTVGGALTNSVTNQTLTVTQASLDKALSPVRQFANEFERVFGQPQRIEMTQRFVDHLTFGAGGAPQIVAVTVALPDGHAEIFKHGEAAKKLVDLESPCKSAPRAVGLT